MRDALGRDWDPALMRASVERIQKEPAFRALRLVAAKQIAGKSARMRRAETPLTQAEYAARHGYIAGIEDSLSILAAIINEAAAVEQTRARAAEAARAGRR